MRRIHRTRGYHKLNATLLTSQSVAIRRSVLTVQRATGKEQRELPYCTTLSNSILTVHDGTEETRRGIMSSPTECELKGGHPPAVKAGGMRITQHKNPKEEREVKPSKDSEESSKPSSSPPRTMMISGAIARGNADFPPEAVQHFHEKPTPTHDARPAHCSRPIVIQQPRK